MISRNIVDQNAHNTVHRYIYIYIHIHIEYTPENYDENHED